VSLIRKDQVTDVPRFDPASLVILERLDEVLRRLPSQRPPASPLPPSSREAGLVTPPSTTTSPEEAISTSYGGPLCTFSSVESMLAWPIWSNSDFTKAEDVSDAVFTTEIGAIWTEPTQEDDLPHGPKMRSSLIQANPVGQDLTALAENFLLCVHSRNPFLDVDHLRRCVSVVAELGPSWDPPSCLVVSGFTKFHILDAFTSVYHLGLLRACLSLVYTNIRKSYLPLL
jgi:hypothetical protein